VVRLHPTVLSYHELALPSMDESSDANDENAEREESATSSSARKSPTPTLPTKALTCLLREIVRTSGCSGDPTSFSILGIKKTELDKQEEELLQRQLAEQQEAEAVKQSTQHKRSEDATSVSAAADSAQ
jgi:hypothetical protein